MSEEIKQGEMVWVWLDSQVWSKDKCELLAVGKVFVYSIGGHMEITTKVTKENPHEKKCELLKEGEELWEYKEGRFSGGEGLASLQSLLCTVYFRRIQGFVVELGNGEQVKVDHPIKFTGNKDTILGEGLSNIETDRHPNRCKIIGAIMSEQK